MAGAVSAVSRGLMAPVISGSRRSEATRVASVGLIPFLFVSVWNHVCMLIPGVEKKAINIQSRNIRIVANATAGDICQCIEVLFSD